MKKNKSQNSKNDTNEETGNGLQRRQLLQSLAAGGVIGSSSLVPEKWSTPAVDSVLLPVHAEASMMIVSAGAAAGPSGSSIDGGSAVENIASSVLDIVIPRAEAGGSDLCFQTIGKCITFTITGGEGGQVSASIEGLNPGVGTLDGFNLPGGFNINGLFLTGSFNPTFTAGGGDITTCGQQWIVGQSCTTSPVTTVAPPTSTSTTSRPPRVTTTRR